MVLWIKYSKMVEHDSAVEESQKDGFVKGKSLWTWIQPGDYELWIMGGNSRYLITTDSQDEFGFGRYQSFDFDVARSTENNKFMLLRRSLRSYLKKNHLKIGRRIGFSEIVRPIPGHGIETDEDRKKHLWVGYDLESTWRLKYDYPVVDVPICTEDGCIFQLEGGVAPDGSKIDRIAVYSQGGHDCVSLDARKLYEFLRSVYEDGRRNLSS